MLMKYSFSRPVVEPNNMKRSNWDYSMESSPIPKWHQRYNCHDFLFYISHPSKEQTFIIDFYFQHYRDLTLVSRDGLTIVLTKTNQIIFEKWLKLLDSTRAQVG